MLEVTYCNEKRCNKNAYRKYHANPSKNLDTFVALCQEESQYTDETEPKNIEQQEKFESQNLHQIELKILVNLKCTSKRALNITEVCVHGMYFILLRGIKKVHNNVTYRHKKGKRIDGDQKDGILLENRIEEPKHSTKQCNHIRDRLEPFACLLLANLIKCWPVISFIVNRVST